MCEATGELQKREGVSSRCRSCSQTCRFCFDAIPLLAAHFPC